MMPHEIFKIPKQHRGFEGSPVRGNRSLRPGACRGCHTRKLRCLTLWGFEGCVRCREEGNRCIRRMNQVGISQQATVDSKTPTVSGSETSLKSLSQPILSNDFDLSLGIEQDVPRWSSLYFMHSEAQRLLGIPSVDSCHPNDVMSCGNETQIEVRHDQCILPHTSSNTCMSGISRSHSQTTLLQTNQPDRSLSRPCSGDKPTLIGSQAPLSSLEPHYSHSPGESQPWEGQVYEGGISSDEVNALLGP